MIQSPRSIRRNLKFHYRFTMPSGVVKEFDVHLNRETLALRGRRKRTAYPSWTRLSYHQCPNCPLSDKRHCPVALNLAEIMETLKDQASGKKIDAEVSSTTGTFRVRTGLSSAFSPLVRIIMTTSGCPILDKLRPMTCLQAPFGDTAQQVYGMFASHMLAQYFWVRKGQAPDWAMKSLLTLTDDVRMILTNFSKRVEGFGGGDAKFNVFTSMSAVVGITEMYLKYDHFEEIEGGFAAHLTNKNSANGKPRQRAPRSKRRRRLSPTDRT